MTKLSIIISVVASLGIAPASAEDRPDDDLIRAELARPDASQQDEPLSAVEREEVETFYAFVQEFVAQQGTAEAPVDCDALTDKKARAKCRAEEKTKAKYEAKLRNRANQALARMYKSYLTQCARLLLLGLECGSAQVFFEKYIDRIEQSGNIVGRKNTRNWERYKAARDEAHDYLVSLKADHKPEVIEALRQADQERAERSRRESSESQAGGTQTSGSIL